MNSLKEILASLSLGMFFLFASSDLMSAHAQSDTLSTGTARELTKAFELIQAAGDNAGDPEFRQAIAIIEQLFRDRGDRMTPYDKATSYELLGNYKFQIQPPDYSGALRAFENALAQNALPEARATQIRYNIAQLYFQEERYPEARRFLQEFIRIQQNAGVSINSNTWYLLAAANTALEDYRGARSPMENALRAHEQEVAAGTTTRKKSYYDLMNAIYSQVGANSERGDLLVRMISFFPEDTSYWTQLAGSYSQAGRDEDAAAVVELAYKNGFITDETRIIQLVQYYSLLNNPYRGGVLLEREMAAGNVQRTQKNLELLAQMWNLAREQKKAAAVLTEAAAMSADGELYYRLGQVYFADEQWREAEENLNNALNRGGLTGRQRANIWLLIGNARYNIDTNSPTQRARAREAWRRVGSTSGATNADRQAAAGWINYVNAVERTECNQDTVERTVKLDNYRKDRASCESIIAIADRADTDFSTGFSQERIEQCRALISSVIDEDTSIITYADGTVDGEPAPGFCQ
ncbi:hypothetical protein [Parvularcula sp. IMCC14364]|uniref:tetratricopeptide repeat protein n=1 Tax=Parvularcula sp. IMCC14364 TaxID=3067902 RepID=UPI0027416FF4|nr:hypothetical protein [Parvularcula sp. IMCC14364]